MELVADAEKSAFAEFGSDDWTRAAGRDGTSRVYLTGQAAIKLRPASAFEAGNLATAMSDVHSALAPLGLAPALRMCCFDGAVLATVHDRVVEPVAGARPDPEQIGAALTQAHRAMEPVPVRASEPWIGFYGEYHEFAMITPSVADDELRELGTLLLPHAWRARVTGPHHYVHRDLHPGNVLMGVDGPCFVDWELAHAGAALDDVAMTACMWAAETDAPARETVERLLRGCARGEPYTVDSEGFRAALALAGLRQGIGAWYTDGGDCTAPYWPYVRKRIRVAAEVLCAGGSR